MVNYIFQQMQNKKDNMLFMIQIYNSTPMTLFIKKSRKHKPKNGNIYIPSNNSSKKEKNNNKAITNGGYQNPNILQIS